MMKKSKLLIFTLLLITTLLFIFKRKQISGEDNITVVLSLDGFRWDYVNRAYTPNLDKMATIGVKAERMIPSFPSVTFANHYTLATGLYPDHHGIVLNSFFAPEFNEFYNKGNRTTVEDGKFYGGEPIWVSAEKQGIKTACFFWVGSEADVKGVHPQKWKRYDHSLPYHQRIDTVITWLSLPANERPELIMWYFDEPDGSGHRLGPESEEILPVITYLDSLVGVFHNRLSKLPHYKNINFIVTSDHGMAQLSPQRQIILDNYIDTSMLKLVDGHNPTMNLKIKEPFLDQVYSDLKKIEHLNVWKHGEAPAHLNHGTNLRLHDITLLAELGWSVFFSWNINEYKGAHGYDISHPDMHTLFYAIGPEFKKNYVHPSFQNIHVYSLLAKLLNIEPSETDGSLEEIKNLLK